MSTVYSVFASKFSSGIKTKACLLMVFMVPFTKGFIDKTFEEIS